MGLLVPLAEIAQQVHEGVVALLRLDAVRDVRHPPRAGRGLVVLEDVRGLEAHRILRRPDAISEGHVAAACLVRGHPREQETAGHNEPQMKRLMLPSRGPVENRAPLLNLVRRDEKACEKERPRRIVALAADRERDESTPVPDSVRWIQRRRPKCCA